MTSSNEGPGGCPPARRPHDVEEFGHAGGGWRRLPADPQPPPGAEQEDAPPGAKTRLVVVEQVLYQAPGVRPVEAVTRYAAWGASREQPYERYFDLAAAADGGWARLDAGWLAGRRASLLVLSNTTRPLRRPERGAAGGASGGPSGATYTEPAVELVFSQERPAPPGPGEGAGCVADVLVPPGEGCRFRPGNLGRLWVRCVAGVASVSLTIIP